MKGYDVLWVPGLDHAGIATQSAVEKHMAKLKQPSRLELGRTAFLGHVDAWVGEYGGTINQQLKRLGVSLDWSRQLFTLDEGSSTAVTTTFVRLAKDGFLQR